MSELKLSREQKVALAANLKRFLEDELDTEIGNMDAERLVDHLVKRFAPRFYNQGIRDAHALLSKKIDDLADDFYGLEQPEID
ncbi:uncharacterized protein (DUF2164 family) [Roseibium hamelinense]|uniref:Uncharacterized protein (DUF2164 family) n=1 Tax=Roseibium hamelinense TaxID=150831 RepID=A0A562TA32_9HYPH|nr:DUF2164 domain-containing protein [Roseibium hamelinense]TWI90465.1 uncharacterized protein (DUF2164 family) [Roseibium hamelinense]